MRGIPAATLARARRFDAALMPDTCRVQRATETRDSRNVPVAGAPQTVAVCACRVAPDRRLPTEDAPIGQLRGDRPMTVDLPLAVAVLATDQIVVTVAATGETVTLDVIGPTQPASYATSRAVRCRQIG